MELMANDFSVLLFAGDINVYSVARAFNDEYNIIPKVYGKYKTFPCAFSRIMDYSPNYKADDKDVFRSLVEDYALSQEPKTVILVGCGDSYIEIIGDLKDTLPANVVTPTIDGDLIRNLTHKEKFYKRCEEEAIPYPRTFIHREEMKGNFQLDFEPPFIIKPSNGIGYWAHPFKGQKKVFKAQSREELNEILGRIYKSGYDDSVIIQDFVPGDDSYMRVLTSYSDKEGRVRMMSLGHVLLEEHTPRGAGNHAVIITETDSKLERRFYSFLNSMKYIGFSNFDIKYDERDDEFKVFEINTRQGRSNYYITGAGENIAHLLVEDYIYNRKIPFRTIKNESLWMVVPKKVAYKYVPKEFHRKMRELIVDRKFSNPLHNKKDRSFKHIFYLLKNHYGHYYKYRKYLGRKKQ